MGYIEVIRQLGVDHITIPTLGRKSSFQVEVVNQQIKITNSGGSSSFIDEEHWNLVMDRIEELPDNEKEMTSRYAEGDNDYNWSQRPITHRIFTPYVPAILRYLNEQQ